MHFAVHMTLADPTRDELIVLTAEVQDYNIFSHFLPALFTFRKRKAGSMSAAPAFANLHYLITLPDASLRMTSCAPPSTMMCGNQCKFRFFLQLLDGKRTTVAHRRFDLAQRKVYIVMQGTGIRHIGIYAFLELHARVAAQVVALPVAGTVGAFAPVFLHVVAVDRSACLVGDSSKRAKYRPSMMKSAPMASASVIW